MVNSGTGLVQRLSRHFSLFNSLRFISALVLIAMVVTTLAGNDVSHPQPANLSHGFLPAQPAQPPHAVAVTPRLPAH